MILAPTVPALEGGGIEFGGSYVPPISESCSICSFESDLSHFFWVHPGCKVSELHPIVRLNNTPLYGYTTFCLHFLLLMGGWIFLHFLLTHCALNIQYYATITST